MQLVVVLRPNVASGEQLAGALVQYPATDGSVEDFSEFTAKVKAVGAVPICATDLLALTLLKAPGTLSLLSFISFILTI